jgi:hypothetical protein
MLRVLLPDGALCRRSVWDVLEVYILFSNRHSVPFETGPEGPELEG